MVDLIDTIVYAGRLKDKSALLSSSSGGAFTALSDFFLENGMSRCFIIGVRCGRAVMNVFMLPRKEKQI